MIISLPEYRLIVRADAVELASYAVSRDENIHKLRIYPGPHPNAPWVLANSFSEEQADAAFDMVARTIAKAQQINGIAEFNVVEMYKALEGETE